MNTNIIIEDLVKRYPALSVCEDKIRQACRILRDVVENDGTIFVCGNGGSNSGAEHIIDELSKGFLSKRPVPQDKVLEMSNALGEDAAELCSKLQMDLKAMSLSAHQALSSAYLNDVDPLMCYAQQLFVMGGKNDVVIGLSTSGNAENILNAFKVAGAVGIKRILFTGNRHGQCEAYTDCIIDVPESETYKVQELHLPVYHAICIILEKYFF